MEELTLDLFAPATVAELIAPLEEPEERPIRLSYSSLSTFELCPLQYKFKYVDREPGIRTPALGFGESLHEALRLFHSQPVPVAPSLGELLDYLDQVWNAEVYKDAREEKMYRDHATQVLSQYHRANAPRFVMPVAIEQRFELQINGVQVTGILDRMDREADGTYEIIDYKTNRKLPPRKIVERDLQLSIYYLAAQEVWGITPSRLTMYYLLAGQRITTTRTAEDATETRDRIAAAAELIKTEQFPPRENRLCNWCDFQAKCPLFAHASRKIEQPDPPDVTKIVGEWITLARRSRSDDKRMRELETQIAAHMERDGLDRLYGEDAAITRARRSDDAAVVDSSLSNGAPEDLKDAVRKARDARSSWSLELTEPRKRR